MVVEGCGKHTKDWVAKRKSAEAIIVATRWGHPHQAVLVCGWENSNTEDFNLESWDFLCFQCAVKAGWVW